MPFLLLLLLGGGAFLYWKRTQAPAGEPYHPPSLPPRTVFDLPMGTRMDVPQTPPPSDEPLPEPNYIVAVETMIFDEPSVTSYAIRPAHIGEAFYVHQTVPPVPGWVPVMLTGNALGWIGEQYLRSYHSVTARSIGSSMFSPF